MEGAVIAVMTGHSQRQVVHQSWSRGAHFSRIYSTFWNTSNSSIASHLLVLSSLITPHLNDVRTLSITGDRYIPATVWKLYKLRMVELECYVHGTKRIARFSWIQWYHSCSDWTISKPNTAGRDSLSSRKLVTTPKHRQSETTAPLIPPLGITSLLDDALRQS